MLQRYELKKTSQVPCTMSQEKALQFSKDLGNTEFKALNGWLESFHKRNNIT